MDAAGILADGVYEILKNLSCVVANEITLGWDCKDELKNLLATLNMILTVMEDAEKKQVTSESVRLWMEELKATAYDADDTLDEYSYEVLRCKHGKEEDKPRLFKKVRSLLFSSSKPSFVCSWKLAYNIKKINEEFNKIVQRKNDLGLQSINMGSSSPSDMNLMMINRETYSVVVEDWKILGRENDKSTIIKMLLEEEEKYSNNDISVGSSHQGGGGGKHVSVISIVGMGGLGKTTIAQLVFNDEAVKRNFDIKVWICVSDPFDVKKLFRNIAKSLNEKVIYDDAATMDDIVCGVQKDLRGKRFLLVLDDVWNENPANWYKLKTPLMVGAKGSKILVTTRNVEVALIMVDRFLPHMLGTLNENDCWSLFKEITFGSVAGAEETPNLVEIGKEMVKRCGGLPLALIFLGSLMRSKKKEEEWEIIRDTKLWHEYREGNKSKNGILPSLRLSYDYLPSHLKQCFAYCCLFPKDWIIKRETLIRLWIAEGFLSESSSGGNTMSMEQIGNEYFQSLLWNSFFQNVVENEHGDIVTCKMHDLVHDLARSVVGNDECLIVEKPHDIQHIPEARRLNLVNLDGDMLPNVLEALKYAKNLRTIFVNNSQRIENIENAFNENKRLRVLDLRGSSITKLPCSIGDLKHLRYLDLFGTGKSSELPRSSINLSELYNLQTLIVDGRNLREIPGDVAKLINLRHLTFERSVQYPDRDLYKEQVKFPTGIGRLSRLQTLTEFNVGKKMTGFDVDKNACGIDELEMLNLLTGVLTINNLKYVTSWVDTYIANLKEKNHLRGLILNWNRNKFEEANYCADDEPVLEGLQPHRNLKILRVKGFMGYKLPSWMADLSCLPNLVDISLCRCNCEQLLGFGTLPFLKILHLEALPYVEYIGNEFYYSAGSSSAGGGGGGGGGGETEISSSSSINGKAVATTTTTFPSLKNLSLVNMRSLRKWVLPPPPTTICFPVLEVLTLMSCSGLESGDIDSSFFPCLKVWNFDE